MKLLLISIMWIFPAFSQVNLVRISKSIEIKRPIQEVFEHVKNTLNDDTWRTEVNTMEADGPFMIGTTYTEDAHIGLQTNFITKTTLISLIENKLAFYQTPENAKYFLSSLREVESLNDQKTKFTYTVEFDYEMSKETLRIKLPKEVLEFSYGLIMSQYLKNLKEYLD
ncbi:MAG: hypothetical protein COW01_05115 [Bdellovibrionales bacterium CG12_big_fil_rev_8_21_14_0_65_38_15]|nr:MAG: hypothetical protein COW79_14395 [Bdellovibrionales bacterium CG22_combo_CG10-13_8_21_14_all_38_13]PIQ56264.1 MAG: hypothetical protein COW01_05115 [Bdellovibrionales bacterium CG12_big_fil_rev_8_21_14_0_65_38_15]PIR30408.1 MAG: hypothetical protein COV38_06560 [Bdellovibrionales bacterium CG11_big_fil_rev_8_21_14_0_20_38_13]